MKKFTNDYLKRLQNPRFIVGILIAIIVVPILLSHVNTYSVIQTGTGNIPDASITHIGTTVIAIGEGTGYIVSFNISVSDLDNDIMGVVVDIHTDAVNGTVTGGEGFDVPYDEEEWVTIFSIQEESTTPPIRLNPFQEVITTIFSSVVSFKARIIVFDNGDNMISETISSSVLESGEIELISFAEPFIIICTIAIMSKKKNKTEEI